jgi:hypothetical protein
VYGNLNEIIYTYYYSSEYSAAPDSISVYYEVHSQGSTTTTYIGVYTYTHSEITIAPLIWNEYNEYYNHSSIPSANYIFAKDSSDRVRYMKTTYFNASGAVSSWFANTYHYNNHNNLDSTYTENYDNIDGSSRKYCSFYYDTTDRLCEATFYKMVNDIAIPEYHRLFAYADNVQPLPNPLQLTSFQTYSIRLGFNFSGFCDERYPPETILDQVWYIDNWINTNDYLVFNLTTNGISINSHHYDSLRGHSFHFYLSGLYEGFISDGDAYCSGTTINWEEYTAVEDDCQQSPPLVSSFTAYPNPFVTGLKIKIDNKQDKLNDFSIYNVKGQLIRNWKGIKSAELSWDGTDASHQAVAPGIYLIKTQQGNTIHTKKVIKY